MKVGAMPLDQLLGTDDSVLAALVQRVVEELDRSGENYAAFGNTP